MKQALHISMGQHLTLTPQLQQAIRLLQLSTVELQSEIQEMLDSNPMLETTENDPEELVTNDPIPKKRIQQKPHLQKKKRSNLKWKRLGKKKFRFLRNIQITKKTILKISRPLPAPFTITYCGSYA